MADETDAVLEREATGDAAEEQDELEELDAENTSELDDAETDGDEQETENEDDQPLSRADVDKALRDQKAKLEESYRQKEENAKKAATEAAQTATLSRALQEGQTYVNQYAGQQLNAMLKAATDQGLEAVPPQWYEKAKEAIGDTAFVVQWKLTADVANDILAREFPDWRMPNELRKEIDSATASRQFPQRIDAWIKVMRAAVTEELTPKIHKEEQAKLAEAAKTGKLKSSVERDRRAPAPTRTGTQGGPGKAYTLTEIDAMPIAEWNSYTQEQRTSMLNRAHELAAKGKR